MINDPNKKRQTKASSFGEAILLQLLDDDSHIFGDEDAANNSPEMKKLKSEFKDKARNILVPMIEYVDDNRHDPLVMYKHCMQLIRFSAFVTGYVVARAAVKTSRDIVTGEFTTAFTADAKEAVNYIASALDIRERGKQAVTEEFLNLLQSVLDKKKEREGKKENEEKKEGE